MWGLKLADGSRRVGTIDCRYRLPARDSEPSGRTQCSSCLKAVAISQDASVRVWRYDPKQDAVPGVAEPGDVDERRAVLVAARSDEGPPRAWMAIDDYDRTEGTLLFGAPVGDEYGAYTRALLTAAIDEAPSLGFTSLVAHWRAGWASAEPLLDELGFAKAAEGIWRRAV